MSALILVARIWQPSLQRPFNASRYSGLNKGLLQRVQIPWFGLDFPIVFHSYIQHVRESSRSRVCERHSGFQLVFLAVTRSLPLSEMVFLEVFQSRQRVCVIASLGTVICMRNSASLANFDSQTARLQLANESHQLFRCLECVVN